MKIAGEDFGPYGKEGLKTFEERALAAGYAVWLPDVQLTDDPLRWILCILLVLAVAVISIVIEVKSIRLLDNIIRDLEQ